MTSKFIILVSLTLLAQNGLGAPSSLVLCPGLPPPPPCAPPPPVLPPPVLPPVLPPPVLPPPCAPLPLPLPPVALPLPPVALPLPLPPVALPLPSPPVALPLPPGSPPPEIIVQNNGQPIVVVANDQTNDATLADLALIDANGNPNVATIAAAEAPPAPAPAAPVLPPPGLVVPGSIPSPTSDDAIVAAALQDATIPEPPPDNTPKVPCKTEVTEEVTQEGAETVIHKPAPIIVNQPPTRLVINHPPVVVKPSAVVFHRGGKTIRKQITRQYLPRPIQVRPVVVRIVKPIEKKVLISKPDSQVGGSTQVIDQGPSEGPCEYISALPVPAPPAPLPVPAPPAPLPLPLPLPLPVPAPLPLPLPLPLPVPAPPAPLPLPLPLPLPVPAPPAPLPLPLPLPLPIPAPPAPIPAPPAPIPAPPAPIPAPWPVPIPQPCTAPIIEADPLLGELEWLPESALCGCAK